MALCITHTVPTLKEILGAGGFHARVHLGDHGEGAILTEGLNQRQRTGASHRDRQKGARVDDGVAHREDGKVFEDRVLRRSPDLVPRLEH